MGDDDGGAALEHGVHRPLDPRLALGIEVRGRLVEHEHPRSGVECPRQREKLAFARRQRHPTLVHERVEPVRQPVDQLVEPDGAARLAHGVEPGRVVGRFRATEGDVVGDGAGEQERLLRHDAELAAQRRERDVAHVVAVDADRTRGDVVEAGDELGDGRLPGAGRADERHGLTGGDLDRDVVQHRNLGLVGEADVVERDGARDEGKIEGVLCFEHRGLGSEQHLQLQRGRPPRLVGAVELDELLDRGEERGEVQDEGGERADRDTALQHHVPADAEHHDLAGDADEIGDRAVAGVEIGRDDVRIAVRADDVSMPGHVEPAPVERRHHPDA